MMRITHSSIAERVRETGGRSSGFDYLRVSLAVSVICVHSTSTSYGPKAYLAIWHGPQNIFCNMILPMFFALSGFLVAGSLERCPTLVSFYGLRILRIVPALAVEVMLSAIIFGPILSSFDLRSYFTGREFYLYFFNIVGYIHYLLPGVFIHNPRPFTVNSQLWTVPFELQCYLALGGLGAIGIVGKRRLLGVIVIVGQCLWALAALKRGHDSEFDGASGPLLILSFLVGVLFFLYRDKIILNKVTFALSLICCALSIALLPHGTYYVPVPATYATVYIGLLNPRKIKYLFSGDYSYGLYLYGFPIQQAFASLGPWTHHWYLNIAVCLPAAFLVAYFSWNLVEKPTLALRRHLPGIERRLMRLVRGREFPNDSVQLAG